MTTLHVLYGSESGNSEKLASSIELTAKEVTKQAGDALKFDVVRKNLKDVKVDDLAGMEKVVVVISTWGEGDPPGTCEKFCLDLFKASSPDLSKMDYTVCAMGDTAYEDFCGCGKRVDEALTRLGAKAFAPRQDMDLEFATKFEPWAVETFTKLAPLLK